MADRQSAFRLPLDGPQRERSPLYPRLPDIPPTLTLT